MIQRLLFFGLILYSAALLAQQAPEDPQVGEAAAFDKSFWQAQVFKNTQRYEQALKAFQHCDSLQPGHAVILGELSVLCHQLRRPAEAIDYAEQSLEAQDVQDWHFQQAAQLYIELQMVDRAIEIVQELTKRQPESSEPLYLLTSLYIEKEAFDDALDCLNRLQKLRGIEPEVVLQKKQIYLELGELNKALEELQVLVDAFPGDFNYRLEMAEVLAVNGRYDDARDLWLEIVALYPVQPVANLRLARYYQDHQQFEKAYGYLKVAMGNEELDIDDKVAVLMNLYSRSQGDSSLTAKAYELVELTVQSAPSDPRSWSVKGDFLLRDGHKAEARTAFLKATTLPEGDRFEIWQQILLIDAELSNWKALTDDAQKTIDLFPSQAFPYLLAGIAHLQLESYDQSAEWLQAGLDLAYGNRQLQAELNATLGQVYHQQEKHQASDQAFEQALRIDPNNAGTLNNYAYYLAVRGEKLSKALEMTEKSNRLSPNNPTFLDTWAWVLFQMKRYEEALVQQEKALALSKTPSTELLEHLGDILFHLNRREEAVERWKQAAEHTTTPAAQLLFKIENQRYE